MPDEELTESEQEIIADESTTEPIESTQTPNMFDKVGVLNIFIALSIGFILIFTAAAGVITNNLSKSFEDLEEQMLSWVPHAGDSPDRVDALVWGITDLLIDNKPKLSIFSL